MTRSSPTFDAATAAEFLCFRYHHTAASLVFNYRDGVAVPTGAPDRFDSILSRAKEERAHLFFHVADLTPEWADPATHAKGKVTTASKSHVEICWYLWLDCDPEKYVGNDPSAAEAHYALQATQISKRLDDGLAELGIAPTAKWSSGAGWQVLIQLDEPISRDEAERLVARLHILLGFDPVVRNSNRLLRVPGTINWKNGNDGRVPTPCSPCYFFGGDVEVEHVRKVLADGVSTPVRANVAALLPASIDWTEALNLINVFTIDSLRARGVEDHALISLEYGDDRLNLHERHKAIGHRVSHGPYKSDSETLVAIAGALLRAQLSPEEAAAVLGTATFGGCRHATKQKSDALKRRAIMRAVGNAGNESLRRQHRAAAIAAGEPAWRDLNQKSLSPLPTVFNIRLALVTMGIGVRLDLFRDRIIITYSGSEHVLQELVSEVLTDRAENAICKYIDERWAFDSTDQQLHRAILQTAVEHSFDPILDYLNEVERSWDGVERLKRAAVDYFEAEDTPLNNAMIEATLVGSVRRARVPGCKFDSIMVLESTEGFAKSSAVALLYGQQFFSDQTILGKSDRESQELLAGVWGFECADLSGISKAEVESIKAFASRVEDRARGAYARSVGWVKRRCVIWATTNDEVYLLSQTGNRRFWPLKVLRPLDLAKFERDRDQLWAEAAHLESKTVGNVNIPESLWSEAAAAQEARRVPHPWEDRLAVIPETHRD